MTYICSKMLQLRIKFIKELDQKFIKKMALNILKIHSFNLQCSFFGYEHYLISPAYFGADSHVERTHRIDAEKVYTQRKPADIKNNDRLKEVYFGK